MSSKDMIVSRLEYRMSKGFRDEEFVFMIDKFIVVGEVRVSCSECVSPFFVRLVCGDEFVV